MNFVLFLYICILFSKSSKSQHEPIDKPSGNVDRSSSAEPKDSSNGQGRKPNAEEVERSGSDREQSEEKVRNENDTNGDEKKTTERRKRKLWADKVLEGGTGSRIERGEWASDELSDCDSWGDKKIPGLKRNGPKLNSPQGHTRPKYIATKDGGLYKNLTSDYDTDGFEMDTGIEEWEGFSG